MSNPEHNPHPLAGDPIEMQTFGKLPTGIGATLDERGRRYGEFGSHASITQLIKAAMRWTPGDAPSKWERLSDDKKEALEMIAHKIGRILNGDPEYHDSWHDIVGYAKLVADTLDE